MRTLAIPRRARSRTSGSNGIHPGRGGQRGSTPSSPPGVGLYGGCALSSRACVATGGGFRQHSSSSGSLQRAGVLFAPPLGSFALAHRLWRLSCFLFGSCGTGCLWSSGYRAVSSGAVGAPPTNGSGTDQTAPEHRTRTTLKIIYGVEAQGRNRITWWSSCRRASHSSGCNRAKHPVTDIRSRTMSVSGPAPKG